MATPADATARKRRDTGRDSFTNHGPRQGRVERGPLDRLQPHFPLAQQVQVRSLPEPEHALPEGAAGRFGDEGDQ